MTVTVTKAVTHKGEMGFRLLKVKKRIKCILHLQNSSLLNNE